MHCKCHWVLLGIYQMPMPDLHFARLVACTSAHSVRNLILNKHWRYPGGSGSDQNPLARLWSLSATLQAGPNCREHKPTATLFPG